MWTAALAVGLTHGAVLSALMGALIAGSLVHDPMIWARSSPPDVQAVLGPPSAATLRRKRAWGVGLLAILLGVFGHLVVEVRALAPGPFPVAAVALAAFTCFQCFNLFDALVIDLGLVLWRPRWAFPPGVADLPGLRDVRWHLGNFGKGVVGGVPFAGLVTLVGAAAAWLAG